LVFTFAHSVSLRCIRFRGVVLPNARKAQAE
jgi:hypothetical protein